MSATGELEPENNNDKNLDADAPSENTDQLARVETVPEFTLNDLEFLARVDERPYTDTVAEIVMGAHSLNDLISRCVQDGTFEEMLTLRNATGKEYVALGDKLGELLEKLPKSLKELEIDDDEAKWLIAHLLVGVDTERVQLFKELAPSVESQFTFMTTEEASNALEKMYEVDEEDELSEAEIYDDRGLSVRNIFAMGVNSDAQILGRELIEEVNKRKVTEAASIILEENSRTKKLTKHVLDVVKISVGVSVGVVIANRLGKK